tara:strand:+ start:279 stop:443 length:165 start_codon:yes stop_codon:yes gene_type:complete
MSREEGSAAIHIALTDGKITVRSGAYDGEILRHGHAQLGTWHALWDVLYRMVKE